MSAVMEQEMPAVMRTPVRFDLAEWYRAQGITVDHPVVRLPNEGQVRALLGMGDEGKRKLKEVLEKREKLIVLMEKDPLRYGWEPAEWHDARRLMRERPDLLVMGGNRSTKTEFAAKEAVLDMIEKPGRIWGFLHSSEDASKRLQHPRVYRYLPPEWRDLGKVGKHVFVCYTEQRGFADNTLILPNGSKAYFFNYKQDVGVLEGYEFDGVWADELIPPEFLVAIRYRLITRRGRLIPTFTPVEGYTPSVGDYLGAAKVVQSRKSRLLTGENVKGVPAGEMPYIMHCVHPKRAVIFFFTEINLFSPYEELEREVATESTSRIKMRAYGYPDKAKGNVFPKFGNHNIATAAKVEELLGMPGTLYLYVDVAWNRNWLLHWFWVSEYKGKKRIVLVWEWPDFETYGEWVVPSKKADGDRGPAQTTMGLGWKEYKKLIRAIERKIGKIPHERRVDARSGKNTILSDSGGTCMMVEMDLDHREAPGPDWVEGQMEDDLAPMTFVEASGDNITEGVNAINGWLEYDEGKPISVDNEPVFYIAERCRNVIDCFRMWTGADGQKGAAKDPIDLPRYAAVDDIQHVEGKMGSRGGGSY